MSGLKDNPKTPIFLFFKFPFKSFFALFTIPKIQLKDTWSLSMEATGDPKTFTFDFDVYKSSSNTDMVNKIAA